MISIFTVIAVVLGKKWDDSQGDMEYWINKDSEIKLYKPCKEDEPIKEKLDSILKKKLDQLLFYEQKDEDSVARTLKNKINNIKNVYIKKLNKLFFHVLI